MAETFEWDDPKLATHSSKMLLWYRCVIGSVDILRVISKCYSVFKHTYKDNGRFMTSMCSMEQSKSCPFCDRANSLRDHQRTTTYAVSVLHLTRKPGSEQQRFVGKLLGWRFGDEKKRELIEIHEITKGRGGLTKVDLRIALKGADAESEKFQKTSIKTLDSNVVAALSPELQKQLAVIVQNKEEIEKIKRLYCPLFEDLMKFVKEDEATTSFNPDEFNNMGAPAVEAGNPFVGGEDPLASLV